MQSNRHVFTHIEPSVLRQGFTLIELLVVITIIVVLLALLTPALDKAIYQAELAVCAAKHHVVAVAAQQYAMNNRRTYPDRLLQDGPSFNAKSGDALFSPPPVAPLERDLRKMIDDYMDINNTLNDALTEPVDFETSNESWCSVSYYMYFGYQFTNQQVGGAGMMKLGNRWAFKSPDDGKTRRYKIISIDADKHQPSENNLANSAHPDKDGVLVNVVWQGQLPVGDNESPLPMNIPGMADGEFILSRWSGGFERGPIDSNVALDDGSVERFTEVGWQAGVPDPDSPGSTYDDRYTRVVHGAGDSDFGDSYINIPKR